MGILERKLREKEQRRNSILDAARNLFSEKGIEETTIAEIAREAELSKGTIYLYFKNGDEITGTILNEILDQEKKILADGMQGDGTAIERLERLVTIYKKHVLETPFHIKIFQYYDSLIPDEIPPFSIFEECIKKVDEIVEILKNILEEGVNDGSLRDDIDPKAVSVAVTHIIYSSSTGLIEKEGIIYANHGYSAEDILDQIFSLLIQSIKRRNSP